MVDFSNEKQDQIFTCSNINESSIRKIRNGIAVKEILSSSPDFEGLVVAEISLKIYRVNGIWSLKLRFSDSSEKIVIISFLAATIVLELDSSMNLDNITQVVIICSFLSPRTLALIPIGQLFILEESLIMYYFKSPIVSLFTALSHNQNKYLSSK